MTTIDISFKNEDLDTSLITITNFPIYMLEELTESNISSLFRYKYYKNTTYDKISLIGLNLIITRKTKKSVTMLCLGKLTNPISDVDIEVIK